MKQLAAQLSAALRGLLPGGAVHRWLAPRPRPGWDPAREAPAGRPAAVLMLICPGAGRSRPGDWIQRPRPVGDEPDGPQKATGTRTPPGEPGSDPHRSGPPFDRALVLTERTGSVEWHKHQVAYPGGVIEAGETVETAALREAQEEIGLAPVGLALLGRLSPLYVPATGFTIHPVVALLSARPRLQANVSEVKRILEVPLSFLFDPASLRQAESMMDGHWVRVPYFDLDGARLWGASAMITAELLALLGWPGPGRS